MQLSVADKIRLLREATRGPDDVFALRSDAGGMGAPWNPVYAPLSDENVHMHLSGLIEIGSYPLIPVDNDLPKIWWIGADFDGKRPGTNWYRDVQRATRFFLDVGANLLVNLSRSAQGAHVRVLFKEPVHAWMARRWMQAWLEEAEVVEDEMRDHPTSFDRLIPPQDTLLSGFTRTGNRRPGNLMGSPLNGRLAKLHGGTLPLDPKRAAMGEFDPDGQHWRYLADAVERREWGCQELAAQLADSPGKPDMSAPTPAPVSRMYGEGAPLPVVDARGVLDFTLNHCAFIRHVRQPGAFTYQLWMALASQLHRFGDEGLSAFHAISSVDPRYSPTATERKWEQTADMHPIKCSTIVGHGYRCPHLGTNRCAGAAAPAYFHEHAFYEPL